MVNQDIELRSLPETVTSDELKTAIRERFTVLAGEEERETRVYYDTFDWRLHRKGLVLFRNDSGWTLIRQEDGVAVAFLADAPDRIRRFGQEFSGTALAPFLEKTLGLRALVVVAREDMARERLRIVNRDEKTVAMLVLENRITGDSRMATVRLERIRGYKKKYRALRLLLDDLGIREPAHPLDGFFLGVRQAGREPGDYSSRFRIELDPDLSAHQAALNIFRQLLEVMHRNEPGIRDDVDTEFLHDFRVAIRRTRSALALFRDVIPEDARNHFKNEFAFLGRVTGPTRDLDVYLLLAENGYRSRLPRSLEQGLEEFFSQLRQQRKQEFAKLIRALNSPRYKTILKDWKQFLDAEEERATSGMDLPVIDLARASIRKAHRRVLREGRAIGSDTPDEALHRLRIRCKKLRYGLEFFASLFDGRKIRRIRKQLKGLQDNLGEFNDLAVQQEMLQARLDELRPSVRKNLYLAAALGGLLTSLHGEQQLVRQRFAATFARFSGRKTTSLFKELFG